MKIQLLRPSLPTAEELLPWLKIIDKNHHYSNFGPLHQRFVKQLEGLFEGSSIALTSSGTSALELAISTLGLNQNSRVLVPSLTFPATALAVLKSGHQPVFSDIDGDNWQLTPEIASGLLANTKIDAILPVATFGVPCSAKKWDTFVAKHNIPVVIDAAGAFGNQQIPELISIIFSLHATKTFSTAEGGLVVSRNKKTANNIKSAINFGFSSEGIVSGNYIGGNHKLSEYHSAIGICSLNNYSEQVTIRKSLLNYYLKELSNLGDLIGIQKDLPGQSISTLCIRITEPNRIDSIINTLLSSGIEIRRWYFPPLHKHQTFAQYQCANNLSNTKAIGENLIGLPFHLSLTHTDIKYICKQLKLAFTK
jgi:dTDP-4-amino-4,6-dideoxygalactose transaminase